jgi:uncharacterized protein (DUF697 family)
MLEQTMATNKRKTLLTNPLDNIPLRSSKASTLATKKPSRSTKTLAKPTSPLSKSTKVTSVVKARTQKRVVKNISPVIKVENAKRKTTTKKSKTLAAIEEGSRPISPKSSKPDSVKLKAQQNSSTANNKQTATKTTALQLFEKEAGKINTNLPLNPSIEIQVKKAKKIVWIWATVSIGAGIVPGAIFSTALNTGVQLKMIQEICKAFNVPFKDETASAIITSILGSGIASAASSSLGGILIKHIQNYGTAIAAVAGPAFNFASTYALGQIFIKHFATHGSLLDFDTKQLSKTFNFEFAKAKNLFKRNASPAL